MNDQNEASYLVVVDYDDDAERKRAEYLLDNWEQGSIESIKGLSRIVGDINVDALYKKLVTKIPQQQIQIHELEEVDTKAARQEVTFDKSFDTDRNKAEWAVEAIMNKRKTVKEDPEENIYGVYTKKGRATVEFNFTKDPTGKIHVTGTLEGYGEAPEFLKQYILDEIQYMI